LPHRSDEAPLLVVTGLTRRHGATLAVAGVDLTVYGGEIVGLLGVNGAGKTSLVEAIAGLSPPDAGTVNIAGIDAAADPRAARYACGLALQATGLPPRLTVAETLDLFAALHGGAATEGLIGRFGLDDKRAARCETLSGGQRQRLGLALALIGDPPLLILDEPTAGLDPAIRAVFHALVLSLRSAGRAILITTHDMAEARRLCDRIIVMAAGRIVAQGAPDALAAAIGGRVTLRVSTMPPLSDAAAAAIATDWARDGDAIRFTVADPSAFLTPLGAELSARGIALTAISSETASLETLVTAIARRQ
jgi:ABC-2 type transport system ATP-binding protein